MKDNSAKTNLNKEKAASTIKFRKMLHKLLALSIFTVLMGTTAFAQEEPDFIGGYPRQPLEGLLQIDKMDSPLDQLLGKQATSTFDLDNSQSLTQTAVQIVPQSATSIGNCFPFGSNSNFDQKFMGFIYKNVPAFTLKPGDQIAFDLGRMNDVDTKRTIFFAPANINPTNGNDNLGVKATAWTRVVSESQTPLNPRGNTVVGDYELIYTAETNFTFNGGGFIIAFRGKPEATYTDSGCEQVLVYTTQNDASGNFYQRFYNLPDQHLGTLDTVGVSRSSTFLGGFKIISDCGINYPNFSSTSGLQLNGSTSQSGNALRLTPAAGGHSGSAWQTTKQSVESGFETTFDFKITNPDPYFGGADGFTFTVQNSGNGTSAIGGDPSCGSCLGYTGISNSLAVEFDAFRNQLRVGANGSTGTYGGTSAIPDLNDGNIHKAKIVYAPGSIKIYIDDLVNPRLTINVNLSSLGLDNGKAFVGFTSATGGGYENHDILNWLFGNNCETNSAPVANNDTATVEEDTIDNVITVLTGLGADTDADNDTLTVSQVGSASHGTVTLTNGVIKYTPVGNYNGNDAFTYKVTDGQVESNTATVTITVNPVNDAPQMSGVPSGTVNRDELVNYSFDVNATDVDSDPNLVVFSLTGNVPAGATIDPGTGVFNWTPSETQGPGNGPYNFTVRATDNEGTFSEQQVSISVKEVNAAPTLSNVPASATIDELAVYAFQASASDSDVPTQTLTFSLVDAPAGAAINATNGAFSWTPAENQGPGVHNFKVRVSDGVVDTDNAVSLTVKEVNAAPVLAAIGGKQVDEETELTFTAAGTDSDDPANTLTYSLVNAPAGALIDAQSGVFKWTPTEAQGTGAGHTFTVKVTDNGDPSASDEEEITVTVKEVNKAPELGLIGNKSIDELTELTFAASSTDVDLLANTLTYSLVNAPAGASINPTTGAFKWTPSEAQGGNPNTPYTFTVKVTDDGTPALSDEETIIVTVKEVNTAPILDTITTAASMHWGNVLGFTASATDGDLPTNTLTFSLINAPAGASIHPSTGVFSWTPAAGQVNLPNQQHSFTVVVTDNGNPALADEQTINIRVTRRPTTLVYSGDLLEQYSDQTDLKATLVDNGGGALHGSKLSSKLVNFVIGSQNANDQTDSNGLAETTLVLTQNPLPVYNVVSSFAGDSGYEPSGDSDAFDITQEDATASYSGATYFSTASPTSNTAKLTLSATVFDAVDGFAGDITKARIEFRKDSSTGTFLGTAPVGLVNPSDPTQGGTATLTGITHQLSNAEFDAKGTSFNVYVKVVDHYTNQSTLEDTVTTITVGVPGTDGVTGGGHLVMELSNGQFAGSVGSKMNFGYTMKFNNSGRNLKGQANIIVRSNGRIYQIKSNAIDSLNVRSGSTPREATFITKANMKDITDPLNPRDLGGNLKLQVEMTDAGTGGQSDKVGITLWNADGGLYFSSRWETTKTIQQLLRGGNVSVQQ